MPPKLICNKNKYLFACLMSVVYKWGYGRLRSNIVVIGGATNLTLDRTGIVWLQLWPLSDMACRIGRRPPSLMAFRLMSVESRKMTAYLTKFWRCHIVPHVLRIHHVRFIWRTSFLATNKSVFWHHLSCVFPGRLWRHLYVTKAFGTAATV